MKTLRFLILMVFVLSLALSAVPARAAGESVVYMALVTRSDQGAPVAAQAQAEFRRLGPALSSAQQAGQLVDFKPEFRAGILMLRFAGRADEAAGAAARMFGRPVYRDVHDALRAVAQQAPTREISTAITPQFFVGAYDNCFDGSVPVNSHIIAILADNTGVVLAKSESDEQDDGSADGQFFDCFDWSSYNEVIPGYRVTFKVYNAPGGTLLGSFLAIAPFLTFTSVNKATAQAAGTGPANKPFNLFWAQPKLDASHGWVTNSVNGTISAAGAWSGDVSTGAIRGGAYLSVTVQQTPRIAFYRSTSVAHIACQLGGNYCEISGLPNQLLTLKVTKGATVYTFSGRAAPWGWFWVNMYTPAGLPILIKPGDKVQGTGVALYTQPLLNFNPFNFVGDIVSGKAPPNKFFDVYVYTYSNGYWYWYGAGSNATGGFAVDTTANFDLKPTETSEAEIWYTDPASGNNTDFTRAYAP